MTPEEWAAAATPGLSTGFKWNEQGDRLQQVPIPGRPAAGQPSAQTQAAALGGGAYDPEWGRRVQQRLGLSEADLQDEGTRRWANRQLRKQRQGGQPAQPTQPTQPTPPAPTPQPTQPQVATSPVTGGPAQIPGWKLPYTAW